MSRDGGSLTGVSVGWLSFRDLRDFGPCSVELACRTGSATGIDPRYVFTIDASILLKSLIAYVRFNSMTTVWLGDEERCGLASS